MKRKSLLIVTMLCLHLLLLLSGCGKEESKQVTNEVPKSEPTAKVMNKKMLVYCGAGMKKPFEEIAKAFEEETKVGIEVTYGNAAQIITQISSSDMGDLFIAGAVDELETINEEYVAEVKELVKHVPVLAVQAGNPKSITSLKDLDNKEISIILGDSKATPIGKLSDKALTEAEIMDSVTIIARTTTAPELATALTLGQCDATIIWRENAGLEGVEIVETKDLNNYIKKVPAARLTCSKNQDEVDTFITFLDTDKVKDIWKKYGYEIL